MDWYFEKELSRLRAEMVSTYNEWDTIRPSVDVVTVEPLSQEQLKVLTTAMDAEDAYFARMEKLRDGEIQPSQTLQHLLHPQVTSAKDTRSRTRHGTVEQEPSATVEGSHAWKGSRPRRREELDDARLRIPRDALAWGGAWTAPWEWDRQNGLEGADDLDSWTIAIARSVRSSVR